MTGNIWKLLTGLNKRAKARLKIHQQKIFPNHKVLARFGIKYPTMVDMP